MRSPSSKLYKAVFERYSESLIIRLYPTASYMQLHSQHSERVYSIYAMKPYKRRGGDSNTLHYPNKWPGIII